MKRYATLYLKSFFAINIVFFLLAIIVYRRANISLPFIRLEFGVLIVSLFVASTLFIFKLEKGNSVLNVILGYIILIPAIFVIRSVFGQYLFRFTWLIYIIFVVVGVIYGIVVYVVSRRYQAEVDELNRLLDEKKEE
ncbi:MAG: hypothetical protein IH571_06395 [Acholeplasmataceae bacterium]|nr:hypothetical protein [Acholeplasmataceae bacterium]